MKKIKKYVLAIVLILILIVSVEAVYGQTGTVRGEDFIDSANSTSGNSRIWQSAPTFILNSQGDFVNTITNAGDPNFIIVDADTPFKIDKTTCELIFLDRARIADNPPTQGKLNWKIQQADLAEPSDSTNWVDVPQESLPCTLSFTEDEINGLEIIAVKEDSTGKIEHKYIKEIDSRSHESIHTYFYKGSPITDKKYGVLGEFSLVDARLDGLLLGGLSEFEVEADKIKIKFNDGSPEKLVRM